MIEVVKGDELIQLYYEYAEEDPIFYKAIEFIENGKIERIADHQMRCSKCEKVRDKDMFYGRTYCRYCNAEAVRKWRKANRERVNELQRKYNKQ